MKNKEKNNLPSNDNEKLHISKSVFEINKEMREKALNDQRFKQEELEKKLNDKRKKAEEARDKRLEAERLELIRLKQGIIDESEIIHEEHEEEIKRTIWQKISSFFYLNKWWFVIGGFFTFIAIFLVIDIITKPRPDIIILMIGENYEISVESDIESYFASFADDYNGNGKIEASVYYIPYTGIETKDYANGVDNKLTTELQSAEGVIVIGNKKCAEITSADGIYTDLSKIYPDYELISKDRLMLSKTNFAEKIGVDKDSITDDWFIAIRNPRKLLNADEDEMQETYDKDFPVFDAVINDLCK